jgi:hypothetical protein
MGHCVCQAGSWKEDEGEGEEREEEAPAERQETPQEARGAAGGGATTTRCDKKFFVQRIVEWAGYMSTRTQTRREREATCAQEKDAQPEQPEQPEQPCLHHRSTRSTRTRSMLASCGGSCQMPMLNARLRYTCVHACMQTHAPSLTHTHTVSSNGKVLSQTGHAHGFVCVCVVLSWTVHVCLFMSYACVYFDFVCTASTLRRGLNASMTLRRGLMV